MARLKLKTLIFMDLETTGLPHMENNTTKITELCAISVLAEHIELGVFPRVNNTFSQCFNPNKLISPEATDITGLSNELLEKQPRFSSATVKTLLSWFELMEKPICLIAHNGKRFDFPILRAEITRTGVDFPDDIYCVDSLLAFRHLDNDNVSSEQIPFEFNDDFDEILSRACDEYEKNVEMTPEQVRKINETTPKKQIIRNFTISDVKTKNIPKKMQFQQKSFKLQDVYTRLTDKPPKGAHEAQGDVVMMMTCAAVYGEKFVKYANENYQHFNEIPIMRPGKRIGF